MRLDWVTFVGIGLIVVGALMLVLALAGTLRRTRRRDAARGDEAPRPARGGGRRRVDRDVLLANTLPLNLVPARRVPAGRNRRDPGGDGNRRRVALSQMVTRELVQVDLPSPDRARGPYGPRAYGPNAGGAYPDRRFRVGRPPPGQC